MPVRFGDTLADRLYYGDALVARAYAGDSLVYDAAPPLLLDVIANAAVAVADRPLLASYTGPVARERNVSAGTEADVASLTTGRALRRLYDQTGAGRHAEQATAARQPLVETAASGTGGRTGPTLNGGYTVTYPAGGPTHYTLLFAVDLKGPRGDANVGFVHDADISNRTIVHITGARVLMTQLTSTVLTGPVLATGTRAFAVRLDGTIQSIHVPGGVTTGVVSTPRPLQGVTRLQMDLADARSPNAVLLAYVSYLRALSDAQIQTALASLSDLYA